MTTFAWTIDDAGSGDGRMMESMQRMGAHFESRGVRSTWYVVPKAGGQPISEGWRRTVGEARAAGHDIQLHGRTHADCFEFGPPNWPATSIVPRFLSEYAERHDELLARYTVENLKDWIEQGLEVFERDLGIQPTSFRAPCGAISRAMYEALRQLGIGYHSCQYISATGYNHLPNLSGSLEPEWSDAIPHRPYRTHSGVVELPILNEYTWRGASAREPEMIALARHDCERITRESPIALLLMHTHGIADNYEYTFRLVDAVIDHVRDELGGEFATVAELIESGAVDDAASVEHLDPLEV